MGDPKTPDGRTGTLHREVPQVLVLAGPGPTPTPAQLIAAWQDALPAAALRALNVLDGAETVTGAQVLRRISAARLSTSPVLLVGLRGGEAVTLRAALDIPGQGCRGALICGNLQHLLPLLIVQSGARSLRRIACGRNRSVRQIPDLGMQHSHVGVSTVHWAEP